MKLLQRSSLVLVFVFAVLLAFSGQVLAAEGTEIVICHTNDIHARMLEGTYDGMGMAKISAKVDSVRSEKENVLFVDAGDIFHGQTFATLSTGATVARAMNAAGYNLMVPGNHDFDYGYERLLELEKMLNFPVISANVVYEDTGERVFRPYIIKNMSGVRVAVFGLSTPETEYKTHPKNVEGIEFLDPSESAREMVGELQGRADVIVALVHLGVDKSSHYTSSKVAEEVDGIDLFIDGHSHTFLPEGMEAGGSLIVSAGEYGKNLGMVTIEKNSCPMCPLAITPAYYTKEESAEGPENPNVTAVIEYLLAENEKITSQLIYAGNEITLVGERELVRTGETNLGNLITDAVLEETGADAVLTNGGGIRASIEPGDITLGDVITVLPFGNYVVVKELTGAQLLEAVEHGVSEYPEAAGHFPHVAGMSILFDAMQPAGERVVSITIGGEEIDPGMKYTLATNDFLAAGGDLYTMFMDAPTVAEFGSLDEIFAAYLKVNGTSAAAEDGRMGTVEDLGIAGAA